mgnify:FL=1
MNGSGANVLITDRGPVFQLSQATDDTSADAATALTDALPHLSADVETEQFSVSFEGANSVTPVGQQQSATVYNYFVGDQSQWRSNVPTYQAIAYNGLYAGIDLLTYSGRSSLKYEFHVSPGADYQQIRVHYNGIDGLSIDADGVLHVQTALGELTDAAPVIYQEIDGQRVSVAGQFNLIDASTYGFSISGLYDSTRELVIDPTLTWAAFVGTINDESSFGIAADSQDRVLVAGWTAVRSSSAVVTDTFVAQLSSSGSLNWLTWLGGSSSDYGRHVAVDSQDNPIVGGYTASTNFAGANNSYHGGQLDMFLAKLTPSGSLSWATYVGGSGTDQNCNLAIDSQDNIFAVAITSSTDVGGAKNTYRGGASDVLLAKVANNGTLISTTYSGGSDYDDARGVVVDSQNNVWVTGETGSDDLPHAANSFVGGTPSRDAFVVKFSNAGDPITSVYVGGNGEDAGEDLAFDAQGNLFLGGYSTSTSLPHSLSANHGDSDAFVVKIANDLSISWSAMFGGPSYDSCRGLAVDNLGNVVFVGSVYSSIAGASNTFGGETDAILTRVRGDGALIWANYFGSSSAEYGWDVVLDQRGNALFSGYTWSTNIPGAVNSSRGGQEAFVAKLDIHESSVTTIAASPNPSVYGQSVTFTATVTSAIVGVGTPTGTVTFKDGDTVLGTAALDAAGRAALTTAILHSGSHSIAATYNGSTEFFPSASVVVSQTVTPAPLTVVPSNTSRGYGCASFTMTFGTQGSGNGQFSRPYDTAIDSSGNIWIVDNFNSRIQQFSSSGQWLKTITGYGTGWDQQFWTPAGIAIDAQGNIWVADSGNNRILRFSGAGTYLGQVGSYGSGNGQFHSPQSMAFDSQGNLWILDWWNNRIQQFNSSGQFIRSVGTWGTGNGQFSWLGGLCVDSSDNVWVTDNNRVQEFSSTGSFIRSFGNYGTGNGQLRGANDVVVDDSGVVWIADESGRIQAFGTNGQYLSQLGSSGNASGQFSSPRGLAVNANHQLLVADTLRNSVQVFQLASSILSYDYVGLVNGDTAADISTPPTVATTATLSSHVGSYPIIASGAADSDYTISYATGSYTITPIALTIDAACRTKVYGSAVPALSAEYSGFVNGDTASSLAKRPTLTTTATASSPVGDYPIAVSDASSSDYTISYVSGTLSVTPATLTVTANSSSKVYGAQLPALSCSYSGFVNGETVANLTTLPVVTTTATAASPVGAYAIKADGATIPNYTVVYVDGSLTVAPAPLTITAENKSKVYGEAIPLLTANCSGFVLGETAANLTALPTLTTTATATSDIGLYPITASGAASPNYTISYVDGVLTNNLADTEIALTGVADTNTLGAPVTLIAVVLPVAPGAGMATGIVVFRDGAATLGTAELDASGRAIFTTNALALGTHSVLAEYLGDDSFSGSVTAETMTHVVRSATSVRLISSDSSSTCSQTVTFTAAVTALGATASTPSGVVVFKDGVTVVATATLQDGVATFSTSTLKLGTHTITASYQGTTGFTASTTSIRQSVRQKATSTTLVASQSEMTLGETVTFTATVTADAGLPMPTGTVRFYSDGTPRYLGSGVLDASGQATISVSSLVVGSNQITALYSGDAASLGSSGSTTEIVYAAPSTVMIAAAMSPSTVGQAVTFTVTVSAASQFGTPTGRVVLLDGSSVIGSSLLSGGKANLKVSSLTAGTHTITAEYQGNAKLAAGSGSIDHVVNQAATSTTLTASASVLSYGKNVLFTAAVMSLASSNRPTTGTVTFMDGSTVLGTAPLDRFGRAKWATAALTAGSHTISAIYNGSADYLGSSATLTKSVALGTTSTRLGVSALTPAAGQPVTLTASVKATYASTILPSGTVTFMDGSQVLGTATLDAHGTATLTITASTVGLHKITAVYSGSANYRPSTSATATLRVTSLSGSGLLSSSHTASTSKASASLTDLALAALLDAWRIS